MNIRADLLSGFKSHWLPIVIFIIVTIVVYHPMFFENKGLNQHDINQGLGANKQLMDYRMETGDEALWMNSMFSGMPSYLNGLRFSGDLMPYLIDALHLYFIPRPAHIVFMSFISFYILLLSFNVRPWLACTGAILFGMNGFNTIGILAGHNAKIDAISYLPLVLASINYAFRGYNLRGMALMAVSLALHLRANHLQITYYLIILCILWGITELYFSYTESKTTEYFKSIGFLVVGALIAVSANAGKVWTVFEYSQYSTRGKSELTVQTSSNVNSGLTQEYAFQYSNGIFEPLVMFIPNILGGSSTQQLGRDSNVANALTRAGYNGVRLDQQLKAVPTYWGNQPLTAPYYLGSIMIFLVVLGILTLDRRYLIWLLGSAILACILSWGKNFELNYTIFDYLPGYNKFRSVTFWIIIPMVTLTLTGFIGVDRLLKLDEKTRSKKILKSGLISLGLIIMFMILSLFLDYRGAIDDQINADWFINALRQDRQDLLMSSLVRNLVLSMIIIVLLYLYSKGKVSLLITLLSVAVFIISDSYFLSTSFLNGEKFISNPTQAYFEPTDADLYILSNAKSGDRVINLINPFNEARTSYYHESVGGYHGAKLKRYQQLIDKHLRSEIELTISNLQNGINQFNNLSILNMLNAKYLLAGVSQSSVIENPKAFGNAWFVQSIYEVNSADQEIEMLGSVDLLDAAIIDTSKFKVFKKNGISNGQISLTHRSPNRLVYEARSEESALAVFSEIFYPEGWSATINGEDVPILRANYVLRSLEVPAGKSIIEFTFEPKSYLFGNTITFAGNILLMLLILGQLTYEFRQGNK